MPDPPRRESRQYAAVVADPNAPSGALNSNDVEELLAEFSRQTTLVMTERLGKLSEEAGRIAAEVFAECLRDVPEEQAILAAQWIEARVKRLVEATDPELAGRVVKLRMHRSALWFAERYRQGGLNAGVAPGDQDRPTVRVTPARGNPEAKR
jgi:hypothetical protein